VRLPELVKHDASSHTECDELQSDRDSCIGDQLTGVALVGGVSPGSLRRLAAGRVGPADPTGRPWAPRSTCAREMAQRNCSNSTAAHCSRGTSRGTSSIGDEGGHAGIGAAWPWCDTGVAGADPNMDPLRSAALTSSDDAEPDCRYLLVGECAGWGWVDGRDCVSGWLKGVALHGLWLRTAWVGFAKNTKCEPTLRSAAPIRPPLCAT
jgi:hypothetical protein